MSQNRPTRVESANLPIALRHPTQTVASPTPPRAGTLRNRRVLSWSMAVVVAAAVGACGPSVVTGQIPVAGHDLGRRYDYGWAPARDDLSPAELLDARLGAFARAVEQYRLVAPGELPPVYLDTEGLDSAITRELAQVEDRAEVSVHIRDIASGEVLFDYFGDRQLIPASNNKLVTASAALALMGPSFTFETTAYRSGDTLFLRGTGDPLLFEDDLRVLAEDVATRVDLDAIDHLVVDESLFSARRFGPGYSEEGPGFAYTAPSGALSLEFNTVEVTAYDVRGSRRPAVRISPQNGYVEVHNRAVVGKKDTLRIESQARGDKTRIEISGTYPASRTAVRVRRRVFDPALFTGSTFAELLGEQGHNGELTIEHGTVALDAEPVGEHQSPPLHEIISEGLAYSNNFISEQLLRALGGAMTGKPGAWDNGREVVEGFWAALGNDPAELVFENGSGFSRNGRVSTSGLVDLVDVAYRVAPNHGLVDSLPIAGEEGTLKARLRSSGRRVRAKTGTLAGVSGLTGVILGETSDEPQLAFSILINARDDGGPLNADQRRAVEDAIVMWVLFYLDDFESRRGFLSFQPMWVYGEAMRQGEARAEVAAQGGGPDL